MEFFWGISGEVHDWDALTVARTDVDWADDSDGFHSDSASSSSIDLPNDGSASVGDGSECESIEEVGDAYAHTVRDDDRPADETEERIEAQMTLRAAGLLPVHVELTTEVLKDAACDFLRRCFPGDGAGRREPLFSHSRFCLAWRGTAATEKRFAPRMCVAADKKQRTSVICLDAVVGLVFVLKSSMHGQLHVQTFNLMS